MTSSPPPDRLRVPAAALAGLVVAFGLVMGFLLYLGWATLVDDDEPTRAAAQVGGGTAQNSDDQDGAAPVEDPTSADDSLATTTSQPVDDRTLRCAEAARTLATPLEAARPALDQWAVHVGAMNKLVTGAITLEQANDFWNRTRVGAHHHVNAFQDADATARRAGVDCPTPGLLGPAGPDLRACARTVAAELRALGLAGTSVDTWAVHVHHMEMLRKGTLSPEDATAMWLSMWKEGVRQLDAYRRAEREVRAQTQCPT